MNKKPIMYVKESSCFPYAGCQDLDHKLQTVTTFDLIIKPKDVLSLIIPFDKKDKWYAATSFANRLRTIYPDYRFSLMKFKSINNQNLRKKYSYVSNKNLLTILLKN